MAKPFLILPEVFDEIIQARDWYFERSQNASDRFIFELKIALQTIESYPERGAFHDDAHQFRYKRVIRFPYLVIYRELADRIEVLAVAHTSQRPGSWKLRGG